MSQQGNGKLQSGPRAQRAAQAARQVGGWARAAERTGGRAAITSPERRNHRLLQLLAVLRVDMRRQPPPASLHALIA
jgi:hypothetical protein